MCVSKQRTLLAVASVVVFYILSWTLVDVAQTHNNPQMHHHNYKDTYNGGAAVMENKEQIQA